jgi:hypothetical protein
MSLDSFRASGLTPRAGSGSVVFGSLRDREGDTSSGLPGEGEGADAVVSLDTFEAAGLTPRAGPGSVLFGSLGDREGDMSSGPRGEGADAVMSGATGLPPGGREGLIA